MSLKVVAEFIMLEILMLICFFSHPGTMKLIFLGVGVILAGTFVYDEVLKKGGQTA